MNATNETKLVQSGSNDRCTTSVNPFPTPIKASPTKILHNSTLMVGLGALMIAIMLSFTTGTAKAQSPGTTKWNCFLFNTQFVATVDIWWGHTAGDGAWACNTWKPRCSGQCTAIQNTDTKTKWNCYLPTTTQLVDSVEIWWGHTPGDATWACNTWKPQCSGQCAAIRDTGVRDRQDGCSTPLNDWTTNAYKVIFKNECNNHDICYSTHWAILGMTDAFHRCNLKFYLDMRAKCAISFSGSAFESLERSYCYTVADTWNVGLIVGGASSFDNGQKWAAEKANGVISASSVNDESSVTTATEATTALIEGNRLFLPLIANADADSDEFSSATTIETTTELASAELNVISMTETMASGTENNTIFLPLVANANL